MLVECDVETYLPYMREDPVRPDLFPNDSTRFEGNFKVYADIEKQGWGVEVNAIVCVVVCHFTPTSEGDLRRLADTRGLEPRTDGVSPIVCPYSIWSYKKGAGRNLMQQLLEAIPSLHPEVGYAITMSPPTKVAAKFHLSNGAILAISNDTTVNYMYETHPYGSTEENSDGHTIH